MFRREVRCSHISPKCSVSVWIAVIEAIAIFHYGAVFAQETSLKALKVGGGSFTTSIAQSSGIFAEVWTPNSASPFSFRGLGRGSTMASLRRIGSRRLRRQCEKENSSVLVQYLAAHIEAQRWIMNPANKDKVIEIVAEQAKLPRDLANCNL